MPIDPIFIDHLSRGLNVQTQTLQEAIDFVVREAITHSANFSNNYNGYWLLLEQIDTCAQEAQDPRLFSYIRFARALVLLKNGTFQGQEINEDDFSAIAPFVSPGILAAFKKNVRRHTTMKKLGISYYPRIHALFDNLELSVDQFVFGHHFKPGFALSEDSLILTMGSCFAENIARFLTAFGFNVRNFASPEEASPSTFPALVDAIINHPDSSARDLIRRSPSVCIIFTAGVGEAVELASGETADASRLKGNPAMMRSISKVDVYPPEAIAESIRKGFDELQQLNPDVRLVCTVSPVPMEASFDSSTGIIVRSAYSKAALMMGVHRACADHPAIAYFPSYEIVKEWAPLSGVQPFAADDGSPRHVSRNLVLIICLMFVKYFVGEDRYREILVQKTGTANLSALRKTIVE